MVALRALDLAPALLPPPGPGQPPRQLGRELLLAAARPLFLAPSPTSTRLLWHASCHLWGLCDAATLVSEDGTEHDCFAFNDPECRCQVGWAGLGWLGSLPRACLAAAAWARMACGSHCLLSLPLPGMCSRATYPA